jgi:hypothetical protein
MSENTHKHKACAPVLSLSQQLLPPLIQGSRVGQAEDRLRCVRAAQSVLFCLRLIVPGFARGGQFEKDDGFAIAGKSREELLLMTASRLHKAAEDVGRIGASHFEGSDLLPREMAWIFGVLARAAERQVHEIREIADQKRAFHSFAKDFLRIGIHKD